MKLMKRVIQAMLANEVPRKSAAITFYAILSLAPILVLLVSVASQVLQKQNVQTQIIDFVKVYLGMGGEGIDLIQSVIQKATDVNWSWETLFAIGVLLMSSSFVFLELQRALNQIFHSHQKSKKSKWEKLIERARSFGLVFITGVVAILFFLLSPFLSVVDYFLKGFIESSFWLIEIWNGLGALIVLSLMFSLILKFVPARAPRLKPVLQGGLLSAVLFAFGKWLMGQYLIQNSTTSLYGAAGSLIFLLLWIYYSTQIVLAGAVFTQILSENESENHRKTSK